MENIKEFSTTSLTFAYRRSSVLYFYSELKFDYHRYNNTFLFDANPQGEPSEQIMLNTEIDEKSSQFSFRFIDDPEQYYSENGSKIYWYEPIGDNHEYFVKEKYVYQYNRIAYKLITDINNQRKFISLNKEDNLDITLSYDNGKLQDLHIIPKNISERKSLRVTREGADLILIQFKPFQRIKLTNMFINNYEIHYSFEENNFIYPLKISRDVYNIIEDLMNIKGVVDF